MKSLNILILIFFLVFPSSVLAQFTDDNLADKGSFYSNIGLGIPSNNDSPYAQGLGLPGVSTFSAFAPSSSNPAHWGLAGVTKGSVAAGITQFDATDNTGGGSVTSKFNINNFQFVAPITRDKFAISIAITPISRTDFRRSSLGSFNPIPGQSVDPVVTTVNTTGSGGVNRFELGAGYQFNSKLSVGYAISVYNLSLDRDIETRFNASQFRPVTQTEEYTGYKIGQRFGIFSRFSKILSGNDQLLLGAAVSLPVSISGKRRLQAFRIVNQVAEQIELEQDPNNRSGNVEIPLDIKTGLTYFVNRFNSFTSEVEFQNWGDADFEFNPTQEGYLKNRLRTGVGYQYHAYRSDKRGLLNQARYSLGTTYDSGHLSINGEDIDALRFHAGIALMSPRSFSSVDLSFHVGFQGTESNNLVKENTWGFKLSLNLAEMMFIQSRFQ